MRPGAVLLAAAVTAAGGGTAQAQDAGDPLRGPDGERVALVFPARPGVCGAGDAILIREQEGGTTFISNGSRGSRQTWRADDEPCEAGDVVVEGRRERGTLVDVDVRVVATAALDSRAAGARGATVVRLGADRAADQLLRAAELGTGRDVRRMILAAALADSATRWTGLLRLAKNRDLPGSTRKSALHWLGREAGEEAARELGGIVRDATEEDQVRSAAVFALSQLPDEQAVELLIDVVRTVPDPRVRKRALFWLAEFDDPRAIALFEEILTRG